MTRLPILLAAALLLAPLDLLAQGNQGAEGLSQARDEASGEGAPGAATAEVGAGTVSGTTTGNSGPPDEGGGGPAELVPELCDAWMDTPVHAACLDKVLGKESP